MSIPLAEALKGVELEPGRTYGCQVNGYWVEVRVLTQEDMGISDEGLMLEPWVELPPPSGGTTIIATPGPPVLPDPPEIPEEDDVP